ncbi:ICE2-domain-containing protein [Westerdykella ornata]|uniref:ICE2-domain-containing protein n=1 Tax=Westerdykella ornata TaxID=318751 RepID=A0A6A6JFX9_WESOR|nr:ICE2-domain-containing protein [Westerdykella ornata]KAF2275124.1 ICE2-domain-containing protein [Westerdykella ornata]
MWLTRLISSTIWLNTILFTIPLAFDVGGRTCGLAFSLSLASYYFLYSILRLITPDGSRFRRICCELVRWTQWIVIPTLLIWSLNKFSIDSDNSSGWVERTFGGKRAQHDSVREWLFGREGLVEAVTIGAWDKILAHSTPVFQILEGFCTILVIQAVGDYARWLVNGERGDSWMIGFLITSASIFSTSLYFVWRITTFPQIDNIDAILIGVALTTAVFLCATGIVSGRGNPVESALLFAYVTLCIYQIFTDYRPSPDSAAANAVSEPALPPLPPIIMASYTTLLHALGSLPSIIQTGFNLMVGAVLTITPSVIISLAYRVFVMYASARIIPAIHQSGARALSQEPSLDDEDEAGKFLGFLSWFSPSILIAVYTSLLMQHFANGNGAGVEGGAEWWTNQGERVGGNVWRWINLAVTMGIYAIELKIGKGEEEGRLRHWKSD